MLVCSRCKQSKLETCFNKDKSKKRGYASYCKICKKERESETRCAIKARRKKYYDKNKEVILAQQKESRLRNSERIKAYEQARKDKKAAYNKEYYARDKARHRARSSEWARQNAGKKNAANSKRRAQKLQATPSWAELEQIELFYINCPKGFHVDHIVPLNGKNVCGLHVLSNLQYLPAAENISKGNRYDLEEERRFDTAT